MDKEIFGGHFGPSLGLIFEKSFKNFGAHEDRAFFVALTKYPDLSCVEVHIILGKVNDFIDTETGAVQQSNDGAVSITSVIF